MTIRKPTLVEYAATKAPPPCRFCVLPERTEVDEAYKAGVPRRLILEWLIDVKGYAPNGPNGVTQSAIDKHMTSKHHLRGDTNA